MGLESSLGIHPQRDGRIRAYRGKKPEWRSYFFAQLLVAFPGHLFKVQNTPYRLHRIIHHHRGKPVHWIVAPPSHKTDFQNCLAD